MGAILLSIALMLAIGIAECLDIDIHEHED